MIPENNFSDSIVRDQLQGADLSAIGGATGTISLDGAELQPLPDERSWIEKAMDAVRNYEDQLKAATAWLATPYDASQADADGFEHMPGGIGGIDIKKGADGIDSAAIMGASIGIQQNMTASTSVVDTGNKVVANQRATQQAVRG
jgi:hypothetical protein